VDVNIVNRNHNLLIILKKKYPWLCEVNFQSLQMYLVFFENAFKNIRKMRLIKVWLVQSESTPLEIGTCGLYGIYSYRQISLFETKSYKASAEE